MPKQFAVMGNPIAHSLSPFIHQQFAEQTDVQLSYEKIQVIDEQFEQQVTDFFTRGGVGLNVTLPFKQRAFALATVITARCQEARAANTLWYQGGQLHADNTDGIGLIRDLVRHLDLANKKVLLLGAGGAARGIIGPLLVAKLSQLSLANRTEEKALSLQADFPGLRLCRWADLEEDYDLILNATSASYLGSKQLNLPASLLHGARFCYDLAYRLEEATPFVAWAREQGVQALDGLGMLVEQAAEAFYIWHGLRPNTEPVLATLRAKQGS